jgi:hypothetical protein
MTYLPFESLGKNNSNIEKDLFEPKIFIPKKTMPTYEKYFKSNVKNVGKIREFINPFIT